MRWPQVLPQSLPQIYTPQRRYYLAVIMGLWFGAFYLIPNHFSPFVPWQVPSTWFDEAVSFWPEMIWVYNYTYVFMFLMYFILRDEARINRTIYSFATACVIGGLIFFFWPTVVPRENFPLTDELDFLTRTTFEFARTLDRPTNCIPSLHVAMSVKAALICRDDSRWSGWFASVSAVAIIYSTMAVKQHFFWDVVTGTVLALLVFWFFHRYLPRKGVLN